MYFEIDVNLTRRAIHDFGDPEGVRARACEVHGSRKSEVGTGQDGTGALVKRYFRREHFPRDPTK